MAHEEIGTPERGIELGALVGRGGRRAPCSLLALAAELLRRARCRRRARRPRGSPAPDAVPPGRGRRCSPSLSAAARSRRRQPRAPTTTSERGSWTSAAPRPPRATTGRASADPPTATDDHAPPADVTALRRTRPRHATAPPVAPPPPAVPAAARRYRPPAPPRRAPRHAAPPVATTPAGTDVHGRARRLPVVDRARASSVPRRRDARSIAVGVAIYDANRDAIGADPNLIHPGLVLTLPPLDPTP